MTDQEKPPGWLRAVFPPLYVFPSLALWMVAALTYALAVVVVVDLYRLPRRFPGTEWAAIDGLIFGILLVFRNKEAYERWWEGRKLWGQLVNDSRNLALKVRAHVAVPAEEHRQFGRLLAGFAHALRLHLRGETPAEVPGLSAPTGPVAHLPGHVAGLIFEWLARWDRAGKLGFTLRVLDPHARGLMDVCGGCERIRNTPLSSSYRALLRYGIGFNLLVVPWLLVFDLGWWTLPVLAVGLYFLLGIELVAEEVEEPFGKGKDDLPLQTYCEVIESFVTAILASGD